MSSRARVGFVIELDQNWLGGINYFRNLITAIYADPERTIDAVFFVGEKTDADVLKGLPAVETVRTSLLDQGSGMALARRIVRRLARRDLLLDRLLMTHRVDLLSHSCVLGRDARTPVAYWIADFQHIHLPAHFTEAERAERNRWFGQVCGASQVVIVSSENAREDLAHLYPEVTSRAEVLRFVPDVAVRQPLPSLDDLRRRHGISAPYLYLPNQYWAHKNHRVVVEALGILERAGKFVTVVSTGNPADYRNPGHYTALCARIAELGIDQRYLRLGVVPYSDLLALIRHSVCLINPSFFEGWSTTVEEARAMDKFIILSDIAVHREQSPAKCRFFDPKDADALAAAMWEQWTFATRAPAADVDSERLAVDHVARRLAFSRRYHEIVQRAVGRSEAPA